MNSEGISDVGMTDHTDEVAFAAFFNERANKRHAWKWGDRFARCSTAVNVVSSRPFRAGDPNNCAVCEREVAKEVEG